MAYHNFMYTKPEAWDHKDKANARWFHCSLIGRAAMMTKLCQTTMVSPTINSAQVELVKQIAKLSDELEQSLRNERSNC